jgi:hypothetical protein
LLHEAINAAYSRASSEAPGMTVREWLQTKSYEFQREYGITVMRDLGIIR